jgi:methylenetetrahydrofolate reductase (NADPH)
MSASKAAGKPAFPISLEFFPPKTAEGAAKLRAARRARYGL